MNAIAKAIGYGVGIGVRPTSIKFSQSGLRIFMVFTLVIMTALSVIYTKDIYRRTFIDYQNLLAVNSNMQLQYGQLLLEQSTWAGQTRIESIAQNNLDMEIPSPNSVVMLKF